jgi:hypothetical protein
VQAAYEKEVAKAQTLYGRALASADCVALGLPAKVPVTVNTTGSKGADAWFKPGMKMAIENPD